jgi:hypothetical protein
MPPVRGTLACCAARACSNWLASATPTVMPRVVTGRACVRCDAALISSRLRAISRSVGSWV